MGGRQALLAKQSCGFSVFIIFRLFKAVAATPFHPAKGKVFGFVKPQLFMRCLCDGELTLFSSNTLNTNDANLLGSPCGKNCL